VLIGLFGSGAEEAVRATTEALRAAGVRAPVLVGGGGVHDADHATWLGADAWTGADARAALETVEAIATRS
jgi:methanogenic corrinoid protein MtbC1